MKKILLSMAMIANLFASSVALSQSDETQMQASPVQFSIKQGIERHSLAPNDLIVINTSYDLIYVNLSGSNIDIPVSPGYYRRIYSYGDPRYFILNIEN